MQADFEMLVARPPGQTRLVEPPAANGIAPRSETSTDALLVLFVGEGARPSVRISTQLLRRRIRSVFVTSLRHACQSGTMIRFDAMVVDATLLEASLAADISQLRQALHCPMLLLSDDADEVDEIIMLELGADACLVKPVGERRLLAHLMALLRRHCEACGADSGRHPAPLDYAAL
jgi:DNA-binding response OmpR family regulator